MPRMTRRVEYAPPGYDPTDHEWPLPGPTLSGVIMLGIIGAVIVVIAIAGYSIVSARGNMPPLPTVFVLPTSDPRATATTVKVVPYAKWITPIATVARGGVTAVPTLAARSVETSTPVASATPKPKAKKIVVKPPVRQSAPVCDPADRPLCSDEKPQCCGRFQP